METKILVGLVLHFLLLFTLTFIESNGDSRDFRAEKEGSKSCKYTLVPKDEEGENDLLVNSTQCENVKVKNR